MLAVVATAASGSRQAGAQSIVTVAGGGLDDGRPATRTGFNGPDGTAVDAAGNILVAEADAGKIRRIDRATGLVSTITGTGGPGYLGAGHAPLETNYLRPHAVAVDASGAVYFSPDGEQPVYRVAPGGAVVEAIAGGGLTPVGDAEQTAVAIRLAGGIAKVALDGRGGLLIVAPNDQRVRRIDLARGTIRSIAGSGPTGFGNGGFSGDGGAATLARIRDPQDVCVDAAGNVYVADWGNSRVRKIAAGSGIITTIGGTGESGSSGDGGAATLARFTNLRTLASDAAGNVFVVDGGTRIRRIDAASGIVTRFAGSSVAGSSGDGGAATLATFADVLGLTVAPSGDLLVSDHVARRVRRIRKSDGIVEPVAGTGEPGLVGDGGPAAAAAFSGAIGLALDGRGNLFVSDERHRRIRKVTLATGQITSVAGEGQTSADNVPATTASLAPRAIFMDGPDAILFSDPARVRRLDLVSATVTTIAGGGGTIPVAGVPALGAQFGLVESLARDTQGRLLIGTLGGAVHRLESGLVSRVAGNGTSGFSGDGGPATQASLAGANGLLVRSDGSVLISDGPNGRIRILGTDGRIDTFAGGGNQLADGALLRDAGFSYPWGLVAEGNGDVLVSEYGVGRVRRLSAGKAFKVFGRGDGAAISTGDDGPYTRANLSGPTGVAVDPAGAILVSEWIGNRVRAVFPCRSVAAPALVQPGNGVTGQTSAPVFTWSVVPGAFRYDLLLDTSNPPVKVVAADVRTTTVALANLAPATTWFWRVVAKGDPFCPQPASAMSVVASFTTAPVCLAPPSFETTNPADGATGASASLILTWPAVAGAAAYEVQLGPTNPPALRAAAVSGTSLAVSGLATGTTYFWSVVARASCDPSRTSTAPARRFTTAGACTPAGATTLLSPAASASLPGSATTLSWSAASGASGFDVFLGTSNPPPLWRGGVTGTSVTTGALGKGTWFWKVSARSFCGGTSTETGVRSFSVTACPTPKAPTFTFVPPAPVASGSTYAVTFTEAEDLDLGGSYRVERATNPIFNPILDTQDVSDTSAAFLSPGPGTVYHRVRAFPACDPSRLGAISETRTVQVVAAPPNVVVTVAPSAVLVPLGETLESRSTGFTLENLGTTAVDVVLARRELGSEPFFTVADPLGGDGTRARLEPRSPKSFVVRFAGPSTDAAGAYQGLVPVTIPGVPLTSSPAAYVALRIGVADSAAPEVIVGSQAAEYVAFPGWDGDDVDRPGLSVALRNPGSHPMELAAEVGPEQWLDLEPGWNSAPVAPGATRTLKLSTRRSRAPNASAFPRYTYVTFRTAGGATSRLLVQDGEISRLAPGRPPLASPRLRSFLVPSVVNATSAIGNAFVSRLKLTNLGGDAVQAELIYTPAGADGFDTVSVRRATVVVPPGDVLTLTDPIVQLFGLRPPAAGSLEVRTAPEKIGLLTVAATVDAASKTGGTFGFQLPTVIRGEGARAGVPHVLGGITATPAYRTNLILVETTGIDVANVRVTLFDRDGNRKGDALVAVPRFGQKQVSGIVAALGGGNALDAGRLELAVESGGGAAAGVVTVIDNQNDDAVTYVSRPAEAAATAVRPQRVRPRWETDASAPIKLVVPSVVNGFSTFPGTALPYTFQSLMGFSSLNAQAASFTLTYRDLQSGQTLTRSVSVPGRKTIEYENVLEQLFGLPSGQRSQGPIFVEASVNGLVYAKVFSKLANGTLGDSFPVVAIPSLSVTGGGSATPLFVDGLEQSVDKARGTRANLILNEVLGLPVTVTVRLYEAGNRTTPIAEKDIALAPLQKLQLSTVFAGLDLDAPDRRKDRTNVQCVVTAKSGSGLVTAVVTQIDNKTGDTKNLLLGPGGTAAASGSTVGF